MKADKKIQSDESFYIQKSFIKSEHREKGESFSSHKVQRPKGK